MISSNIATALRPTVRQKAQAVVAHAVPDTVKQVAKQVVPAESLWYRMKREFISLVSNINYNKADVHAVTNEMAAKVKPNLKPGDILLRRTEGTSGNFFIPSWWKHAGVYVGDGQVVDATFHGIGKRTFEDFMTGGDHVMIVRAKNLNASQRKSIANYAEHQIGKPYDFDFNFTDEARQSCTELADHAVTAGAGKALVQKNWIGSVTGDAFKNENFKLIWSSDPTKSLWK